MSAQTHAAELAFRGYRRVSNKYGTVARIDCANWRRELNNRLRRDTSKNPGICWEDHYRRCYSQDKLDVGRETARLVPTSSHDYIGFIDDIPF